MAVVNKFALLVGCNYSSNQRMTNNQLQGCINDVDAMETLIRHRFGFENITILTEKKGKTPPTCSNILDALTRMIVGAKMGDTLLFYFSGAGALVNPPVTSEKEIKRGFSAIIPCDLMPITAAHILPIISPLKEGAILTFICDSSYSGGLFDRESQIQSYFPDYGPDFRQKTIPSDMPLSSDVGGKSAAGIPPKNSILISSSRGNEESVEVYPNGDKLKAIGAFSNAIQTLLNSPEAVKSAAAIGHLRARNTNREVAQFTRGLLGILAFDQHPYLNCSEHNAAAPFLGNVGLLG